MIKHIVLWTIKDAADGINKQDAIANVKAKLESLSGKIEGLLSLQVGLNKNTTPEAFDICLVTEHTSWEALQFYQGHPLHKEVAGYVNEVRKSRAVADYEF